MLTYLHTSACTHTHYTQGKSVTLAITSAVLALLGCDVGCVSYSEYLSSRDFEAFEGIFRKFGVAGHIHYRTFNSLCEEFINAHGDVRLLVRASINKENHMFENAVKRATDRPRILLIDEVDVFFSKDFYGNVYRPMASISDETITDLISYVWSIRENRTALKFSAVTKSAQYKSCLSKYSHCESLIAESVKAMLHDVRVFKDHKYEVDGDRIGYKEQDGMSFTVSYGYQTMFAYFEEHEKGELTQGSRDRHVSLSVNCGMFSYAEIPKLYNCVMGVTGT